MEFKLGILGFGNMGSAIAEGALLKGVVKAGNVYVYNRSNPAMLRAEELGFNTVSNENEIWESSDIILLAVKPQYMEEALSAVKKTSDPKAVISVAAGLTVGVSRADVEEALGIPEGKTSEDRLYTYTVKVEDIDAIRMNVSFNSSNIVNSISYDLIK
jgi:pyrroline-5-carboxylate reductase